MAEDTHDPGEIGLALDSQAVDPFSVEGTSDPLIAAFKKDVDRTLLIDNLRRTYDQRARRMNEFLRALDTLRAAGPTRRP